MEIVKNVWVIMDKNHKVLGMGSPRRRELKFIDSTKGTNKILTYRSRKMAESAFKVSGFYTWDCREYMTKTYGSEYSRYDNWENILEAVEAEIILKF